MKLKLAQRYDDNNPEGAEVEILDMKRDSEYTDDFAVLAALAGRPKPIWLTIVWFMPEQPAAKAEGGGE